MTTDGKDAGVSVPENGTRHLARNVPLDFSAYCRKIITRNYPQGIPSNARILQLVPDQMLLECYPDTPRDDGAKMSLARAILDIGAVYDALMITVDQSISPVPVHDKLRNLLRSLERTLETLDDEARDAVVMEMGDYGSIQDIPITKDAFDHATSLAEKVTIARRVLSVTQSQVKHMTEHFDYKRRMITPGKPPTYAFSYAVFALADLFEKHDGLSRPATVVERVNAQDAHWTENYVYEGPFLDFVTAFFQRNNPLQIDDHVGTGFANAVRKATQKRRKAPDLHRLLEGEVGAQQVLDFMIGLDQLR